MDGRRPTGGRTGAGLRAWPRCVVPNRVNALLRKLLPRLSVIWLRVPRTPGARATCRGVPLSGSGGPMHWFPRRALRHVRSDGSRRPPRQSPPRPAVAAGRTRRAARLAVGVLLMASLTPLSAEGVASAAAPQAVAATRDAEDAGLAFDPNNYTTLTVTVDGQQQVRW